MNEINRVKDALDWCNKAINMIDSPDHEDAFKFGYADAVLRIIQSKLIRELDNQSE